MNATDFQLMVTLWPSFKHFSLFANDSRLAGVRLNSAMMSGAELDTELEIVRNLRPLVPLFYDIKGRQLRVAEVIPNPNYLEFRLNHAIEVATPTPVLFKAGADVGLLTRVEENGLRLIFEGGNPHYKVIAGESLHIRDKSLVVHGPIFTDAELQKIEKVKAAGFKRWYLSYVEDQTDVDQFQDLVGKDSLIYLKIESLRGLQFVAKQFKKKPNLVLAAACGDLYVEVDRPHDILSALQLIVSADPEAQAGSRMLLSVVTDPVPSLADLAHLAALRYMGYGSGLLCDELCLKGPLLETAVNVFDSFRQSFSISRPSKKSWWSRFK